MHKAKQTPTKGGLALVTVKIHTGRRNLYQEIEKEKSKEYRIISNIEEYEHLLQHTRNFWLPFCKSVTPNSVLYQIFLLLILLTALDNLKQQGWRIYSRQSLSGWGKDQS